MTQLKRDYNLKMLSLVIVSGKYLQTKNPGLPSLGESLANKYLPLMVAEVFLVLNKGSGPDNFTTVMTRKQQNCRDSTPLILVFFCFCSYFCICALS